MRNMRNLLTRNQNFTIFAQNLWNLGLFTRILMELLGEIIEKFDICQYRENCQDFLHKIWYIAGLIMRNLMMDTLTLRTVGFRASRILVMEVKIN